LALPVPKRIQLEAARPAKGIDLSLAGTFENDDQARSFADGLAKVNKQAVEALEKWPGDKLPAETNKLLRTTLGNSKIDAKGKTVTVRSQVPAELLKALPELLIRMITLEPGPPSVPKIEKNGGQARLRLTTSPAAITCLHDTRGPV
jgi:hypothetical protein